MPRALVTGCNGFIGSYLAPFLRDRHYDVLGTLYEEDFPRLRERDGIEFQWLDVRDKAAVEEVITSWRPELIVHLAAESLVMPSWQDPVFAVQANILGTLHLLEAVHRVGLDPLILLAGSSAQYGLSHPHEIPLTEGKEFRPTSPYAATKVGAEALAYAYFSGHHLRVIRMRLFNVTGPGKVGDACADFASGIAALEQRGGGVLGVGNLTTIRDISDVGDALRAMDVLIEKGIPGEAYNICSGQGTRIEDALDILLGQARVPIEVRQTKQRPTDEPVLVGDNSKLRSLGWQPTIPISQTLANMLDYWRCWESSHG